MHNILHTKCSHARSIGLLADNHVICDTTASSHIQRGCRSAILRLSLREENACWAFVHAMCNYLSRDGFSVRIVRYSRRLRNKTRVRSRAADETAHTRKCLRPRWESNSQPKQTKPLLLMAIVEVERYLLLREIITQYNSFLFCLMTYCISKLKPMFILQNGNYSASSLCFYLQLLCSSM
jgi:hypothetical protein